MIRRCTVDRARPTRATISDRLSPSGSPCNACRIAATRSTTCTGLRSFLSSEFVGMNRDWIIRCPVVQDELFISRITRVSSPVGMASGDGAVLIVNDVFGGGSLRARSRPPTIASSRVAKRMISP